MKFISLQMDVGAGSAAERSAGALALLTRACDAEGAGIYVLPEYALSPLPNDAAAIAAQAESLPGPLSERFQRFLVEPPP